MSEPERSNGFVSKTVQEAIEEASDGIATIPPSTTVGAVTVVAYSLSLDDDTTYLVDTRVVTRRTDLAGDTGDFQVVVRAKRESGGPAQIVGHILQKRASRGGSGLGTLGVDYAVSGNDLQITVTGVAAKTFEWQPGIEFEKVA